MVLALFKRGWTSPTLTTWASFAARSLSLVLVLPLALARLAPAEVQIWQAVLTVGSLLLFLDLGLSPTFTRLYARAVRTDPDGDSRGTTDFAKVEQLWRTTQFLYRRAALVGWVLILGLGIPALWKPIHALENPATGWYAVGLVAVTSPWSLLGLGYSAYLQGLNHVALSRRWEALTGLGAILTSVVVLLAGGGALALIASTQFWTLLSVVRNRMLARQVEHGRARQFGPARLIPETWTEAWPAVWRSGLGVLLTSGFIQATGLIYAQIGDTVQVASYMVALRYLTAVSQFSNAPFYSKVPTLARLHALGQVDALVALAKRGMRFAHMTYAVGSVSLAFLLPPVLKQLGSDVPFVAPGLWWLLVLGIFFERYGAMHLQLYSTTNKIVWHIANGISGGIIIVATLALLPVLGVYAFPAGIVLGYGGFYAWYSAKLSHLQFQLAPLRFDLAVAGVPVALLILGAVVRHLMGP